MRTPRSARHTRGWGLAYVTRPSSHSATASSTPSASPWRPPAAWPWSPCGSPQQAPSPRSCACAPAACGSSGRALGPGPAGLPALARGLPACRPVRQLHRLCPWLHWHGKECLLGDRVARDSRGFSQRRWDGREHERRRHQRRHAPSPLATGRCRTLQVTAGRSTLCKLLQLWAGQWNRRVCCCGIMACDFRGRPFGIK